MSVLHSVKGSREVFERQELALWPNSVAGAEVDGLLYLLDSASVHAYQLESLANDRLEIERKLF